MCESERIRGRLEWNMQFVLGFLYLFILYFYVGSLALHVTCTVCHSSDCINSANSMLAKTKALGFASKAAQRKVTWTKARCLEDSEQF